MDTSFFSPEAKSYIDQSVAYAARQAQQALSATRNRAYSSGSATNPASPTPGASFIPVAVAKLTARASGIFQCTATWAATGMTAAGTVDTQMETFTGAPGITLSGNTQVGPGTAGAGVGANSGVYVSSGAAGIGVAGTAGGLLVQYDSGSQVLATAETTASFSWAGLIGNSITATATPVGFAAGNDLVLVLQIKTSAAMTIVGLSLSIIELA